MPIRAKSPPLVGSRRYCPNVNSRSTRTLLAVGAGVAVLIFGTQGSEDGRLSKGVLLLALIAVAIVWYLTRPQASSDKK
jgi:hypothetical protein